VVLMAESFLTPADVAEIKAAMRDGMQTVQAVQDPLVTVTFNRAGSTVATVTLIRIRLDSNQPATAGQLQGAQETRVTGTLKAWAADVEDVKGGDRFIWDGTPCVVSVVEPARYGFVVMHFERLT
jgi:hypothetical protein